MRTLPRAHRWIVLSLLFVLALSVVLLPVTAGAQVDDVLKLAQRAYLHGNSRPTRITKGALGELNIAPALTSLGKGSYRAETRYVSHQVLDHGMDAIYRRARSGSFNIVEAKATTNTGRLYRAILGASRAGGETEMDDRWIAGKLDEMVGLARRTLDDDAADAAARASARRTLRMADEIRSLRPRQREKTLVVTRLRPVDRSLGADTIHRNLLDEFDHVIEMRADGVVLRVHK